MELGETTVSSVSVWPSRSNGSQRRRPALWGRPHLPPRLLLSLLATLAAAFAPSITLAQSPASLWQNGDYAAAYEGALQADPEGATYRWQLLAARAAADHAVYVLAQADIPLGEQVVWLRHSAQAAERATALDPGSAQALVYLARARGEIARRSGILQNLNVAGDLKQLFDAALALNPTDPDALVGLGMWHLELVENGVGWLYGGRRDQVLPLVEAGVAAAPQQVNLRVEYATALKALGQPERAREQLELALTLPATSAVDRAEQERARALLED